MTVYLMRGDGQLTVAWRVESPGATASIVRAIGPGWRLFGKDYEEWAALPAGPHQVAPESALDCHAPH